MCHCVINYKIYLSSFSILKIGAVRHIRLSKLKNLTLRQMLGPICITVPNFIKIGRTVAEMWRFNGFYRAMLCMRGTSDGPVSVCLSVCLCLCLKSVSVISRCSTKTAKRRITQTKPHDSSRNLVFEAKDRKILPRQPVWGRQMQVGWVKIDDFRLITGYILKTVKDRNIVSIKVE